MTDPVRYPMPATLERMPVACHYAIEASAGTGKTYLIEHRVLDYLLRADVTIDQILVVTFTEKATSELSNRVRALLQQVADHTKSCEVSVPHWVIDDAAREKIERALIDFDRVAISTIHGFCHRLVGENAFAGGKQLRQEQIADVSAFEAAYRAELRERFAVEEESRTYLQHWLASGKSPRALEELLFKCIREKGPLRPTLDPDAMWAAAKQALEAATVALDPEWVTSLKKAGVHASTAKSLGNRLSEVVEEIRKAGDSTANLVANLDGIKLNEITQRLEKNDVGAHIARAIASLQRDVPPLSAAIAQKFLPAIRERLELEKHEHGLFDFDDMLAQLWRVLDGPRGAAVAAEIRQRYKYALIDEFQDTDDLQWKIFRRIYVEEPRGAYLSIIGDPKQAIYGFRGADVYTYFQARDELQEAGGVLIRLGDNYRSTPQLVEAYNYLFGEAPGAAFFSEGIDYEPVSAESSFRAMDDAEQPLSPFLVLVVDGETKLSSSQLRDRVKGGLVDAIETTLSPESGLRVRSKDGSYQASRPGHCFVLTRSVGESHEISDALRERGIPCALYQQEGLLTSDECGELIDLLSAIANPGDRSSRLRAWQTRFFAVRLADLTALRDIEDSHPLLARLYDWKEHADRLDYERLFSSILDTSGVIEREVFLASSERSLTNIMHLFELLLEDLIRSRCDLHELISRLRQWVVEAELLASQDRNLQRLESDRDAVQIMTVHKSKGLEAPFVFLYGGFGAAHHRQVNVYHQGGERIVNVGPMPGPVRARAQAEAAAEDERLLYVAITRAAARVTLPYLTREVAPNIKGYYRSMNERLDEIRSSPVPGFTFQSAQEPRADTGTGQALPAVNLDLGISVPRLSYHPAELAHQRKGFVVTSYTRMKHASGHDDDDRAYASDQRAPLPDDELPGGAESGILVHELLEHVSFAKTAEFPDFDSWSRDEAVLSLVDEAMRRHDRPSRYRSSTMNMVWRALKTPLVLEGMTLPPICECRVEKREIEFLYPLPGQREGFVRGFIDLFFAHEDRLYVLDWKTDILASYDQGTVRQHVADNYQLQLDLYSVALARMVTGAPERFGGLIYAFVRGMGANPDTPAQGVFSEAPDSKELQERYRRLEGVSRG